MTAHDQLKAAGITPTIDCERSYELGYAAALGAVAEAKRLRDQHKAANRGNTPGKTRDRRYN